MVNSNNLDELFGALRSTEPYLPDDGFTSAVIARIPEAQQLPAWLSNLIMLSFTAIGSAIAASQLPVMKIFTFNFSSLLSLPVLGVAALSTFIISYIAIWMAQNDSI
jgi:hypothetical protein